MEEVNVLDQALMKSNVLVILLLSSNFVTIAHCSHSPIQVAMEEIILAVLPVKSVVLVRGIVIIMLTVNLVCCVEQITVVEVPSDLMRTAA